MSTRPVVIVMSRVHSVSRWSVAEWPCTPTFATRPPALTIVVQSSKVSGPDSLDDDVGAEPCVSSITRATGSSVPLLIVHVRTELERFLQSRVGEVDRDDAPRREELRGHDRREPYRTGTDDRHRVAGLHAAVQDADLECGREDVCEEDDVFIRQALGHLVDRRVGERTRANSAWRPSIVWPKIQPPPPVQRPYWPLAVWQRPQEVMHETSTRSPGSIVVTAEPTSTMVPTASCPRIVPGLTSGTSPLRMCRSVPQIVAVSMRTIASVGSKSTGSGTASRPADRGRDTRERS